MSCANVFGWNLLEENEREVTELGSDLPDNANINTIK
jgi:hypothetical protein